MPATITLGTNVTLGNAEALRQQLLDGFADHAAVNLDATSIAEVDLSFLQLIESAREYAAQKDKSIELSAPANAVLAALLDRAGFLAAPTDGDIEFWFHGELPQ